MRRASLFSSATCKFSVFLLALSLCNLSITAVPFVLIDIQVPANTDDAAHLDCTADWEGFRDSDCHKSDDELDPGSWRPIFEPESVATTASKTGTNSEALYYSGFGKMMSSISSGDVRLKEEAAGEIKAAAESGFPAVQSVVGFLYGMGHLTERNKAKAYLHHYFAAEGGNMQSKMVLAYLYMCQDKYEKSVKLYAELAEVAVNSFQISKDSPVIEPVRLHRGAEEDKDALRKFGGEKDEDIQIFQYQAQMGNAVAMYKLGMIYYFGLRGLRRDHAKALSWLLKAAEKGEPRSMELLGEIAGAERNYTKALEWLILASKQQLYSAYNGMGYMYIKGHGLEKKNHTKAKEYFEKAAENDDSGGQYNLGVMYLKGIGVERDVKLATKYFMMAADNGRPKGFYQLAKMFHTGVGFKKNIVMATALYKLVAERGPWISMSRWALESYIKGDVGRAFMLYSRMAEMGYEGAQSNAAWILDKHGERSMCMAETGFCTDEERRERAQSLWQQAYKQGNEYAAFVLGEPNNYTQSTAGDYGGASEFQTNPQVTFGLESCGCRQAFL